MRAIAHRRGLPIQNPEALLEVQLPDPRPGPEELLVRVQGMSINPIDTKLRQRTPALVDSPQPVVLGFDAAGTVVAVGARALGFREGDLVWYSGCAGRPGCNAELQPIDARLVAPRPACLSAAAAAAMPLCALTAWEALFEQLGIDIDGRQAGRHLLVLGGGGGVGSMAIQLASRLAGLVVTATASRPESRQWCSTLGAAQVLDHSHDWVQEARAAGLAHADWILCCGEPSAHWSAMADYIAPRGGICALVDAAAPVDLNLLKRKSARFVWEFMFTRPLHSTPDQDRHGAILSRLAAEVEAGRVVSPLRTHLGRLSVETLREGHRRVEGGHTVGKIAIDGFD
jgi:NADPH:quinone reductase